ncbi:unnamed protein product [Pylaiella littoralis]
MDSPIKVGSPMKPGAPWAVKLVHEGKEQGLSPEKIRQKLVREGLELEKIDSVLGPSSAAALSPITAVSATDEPSSPSFLAVTSPQHRQLSSRKFHNMLLVGLPPTVVRQKMAMEGCPPEDINSFFAAERGSETATEPGAES